MSRVKSGVTTGKQLGGVISDRLQSRDVDDHTGVGATDEGGDECRKKGAELREFKPTSKTCSGVVCSGVTPRAP